jgi:hypothetical protein
VARGKANKCLFVQCKAYKHRLLCKFNTLPVFLWDERIILILQRVKKSLKFYVADTMIHKTKIVILRSFA